MNAFKKTRQFIWLLPLAAAGLVISFTGCSTPNPNPQATADAYEQVYCGMSRADAYALLGEPQSTVPAGDLAHCRQAKWSIPSDRRGRGHWTLTFRDDRVHSIRHAQATRNAKPGKD